MMGDPERIHRPLVRSWLAAVTELGERWERVGLAATATLALLFGTGKLVQLVLAIALGFHSQLELRHVLGGLSIFAEDLLAAALLGGLAGGLGWVVSHATRSPWLRLGAAWVLVLPAALLTLLSIALYRLYQTPLTFGQLLLMGTLREFTTSVRENLNPLNLTMCFVLPGFALLGLPLAGRWSLTWLRRGRSHPRRLALLLSGVLLLTWSSYLVLPGRSLIGLELNPVVELVRSATRELTHRAPELNLGEHPTFDRSRIFDPADPTLETVEQLVDLSQRPAEPMNLLLLVGESWAASQHCLLGGPPEACPRLRQLRRHALLFSEYYSITPVSMKSLFSLTCSLYPMPIPQAETYVHGNIDCRSISEILKEKGYATLLLHSGHFHYSDKLRYFQHRRYDVMRDSDTYVNRRKYPTHGWGADDRAMRDDFQGWLATLPPRSPWHALLIPVTPHYPYQTIPGLPEPFGNQDLRSRYLNQMVLQDQIVGDLWDDLERRGQLERTLIVLVGDHGQAFEEHPGNTMHGSYIYEESVKVPLIFLNPRLFRDATSRRLGNHVDLTPTILDVMGLPPEPRHEGRSLLNGYQPHRIHFFTNYAHHQLGLRDGRYKFIHDKNKNTFELFDLLEDRAEQLNIASLHREKIEKYQDLTAQWDAFYKELIPNYEAYRLPNKKCVERDVCFLDELSPTFMHGKALTKKNALGGKIKLDGQVYGRGWGVEAPSILRFSIVGLKYEWLEGFVGHDDDIYAGQLGETVSAEIYVDEKLAFSSGKMKKGMQALPFKIPVAGASSIELYGHDMDGIGYRDNIDWADIRLTR